MQIQKLFEVESVDDSDENLRGREGNRKVLEKKGIPRFHSNFYQVVGFLEPLLVFCTKKSEGSLVLRSRACCRVFPIETRKS